MKSTSVAEYFGKNFEDKIIQAFLGEKHFAEQIIEILDPRLFKKKYTSECAKMLVEYYNQYESVPTTDSLEAMIKSELQDNEIIQKSCMDFVERIKTKPLNGESDFVKEKSLSYFRTQHIRDVLLNDVVPAISAANFEDVIPLIQSAITKGGDRNVGYDYMEDTEKRFTEESRPKIPTGYELLDKLLNGGVETKRLLTVIAPGGAGKSTFLANLGAAALMKGKVVVHYTFELDQVDVARKYDGILTNVEINSVPAKKGEVLLKLKKILPPGAKLIIKEYPMKGASVQTIKSHLNRLRLQKSLEADLIIIDYGDLVKPAQLENENRMNLRVVWEDMKGLAQRADVPVYTATQTNRSGYNDDVITADQVSEDFSKIMTSDVIITMARNLEQKAAGVGKMHLAKSRQGEDGQIFAYGMEPKKGKIEIFELTEEIENRIADSLKTEAEKNRDEIAKAIINSVGR